MHLWRDGDGSRLRAVVLRGICRRKKRVALVPRGDEAMRMEWSAGGYARDLVQEGGVPNTYHAVKFMTLKNLDSRL